MSWAGSKRRQRLPANWPALRRIVLEEADYVCEIRYEGRCVGHASEVDHIIRGDDHSFSNLRAACKPCHYKKSSVEGLEAQRSMRAQRKRPPERHPGTR